MTDPQPGWYSDPADPDRLRWWDGMRWTPAVQQRVTTPGERLATMDRTMGRLRARDPRPFGWLVVVVPVLAIVGGQLVLSGVSASLLPTGYAARISLVLALMAGAELFAGALGLLAARPVAARFGWGDAWGVRRPRLSDLAAAAAGVALVFATRMVIGVAAQVLTNGRAVQESSNLHLPRMPVLAALGFLVVAAVIAPVVEEFLFRGLLLRALARRWSFWPAAVASSAAFGLLHTYQVTTLLGAATLGLVVFLLGLVNCLLVRATDSIVPGIVVHAVFNALAVVVSILSAGG
ncbi:CPBP family intramembrane metalloprotease [Calidifontibacter sp. DB0510]|uniref:CPBP family intramembrane metalloprotease n=1 Tax=Metallococcus carri TaxID=1656884 RepID=A0A967AY48_9MICO|nr:CPBP family glutamic-type intramembrane protease [Metallococcus carri]NHN55139.1 CPBP family intramembrane metalloprotease [Metallococcus carri]NOP36216.1 CPBP family intramembrane metalloprotease [Calidifontibacter sp. DB2511S]